MIITKETSDALDIIVGAFFDLNRSLDRCVSWMQNIWSMPQAANIIHLKLAHLMPIMADNIVEIKDKYNLTTTYPVTHADNRTYQGLDEMFDTMLEEFSETYDIIKMVIATAKENNDWNVFAELIEFLQKFNIVFGQIQLLKDKAAQMPSNYDMFDKHIEVWGIVGL